MSGGKPGKDQSAAELKTARTLNTVAIIGASHPIYTASRALARDTGLTRAAGKLVPTKVKEAGSRAAARTNAAVQGNSVSRGAAKFAAKHGKAVAIGTGVGWLGFHGAELAGDFMARRSINNTLDRMPKKEHAVTAKKSWDVSKGGKLIKLKGKKPGDYVRAAMTPARQRAELQAILMDEAFQPRGAGGGADLYLRRSKKFGKSFETMVDFSKAANRGTGNGQSLVAKKKALTIDEKHARNQRVGAAIGGAIPAPYVGGPGLAGIYSATQARQGRKWAVGGRTFGRSVLEGAAAGAAPTAVMLTTHNPRVALGADIARRATQAAGGSHGAYAATRNAQRRGDIPRRPRVTEGKASKRYFDPEADRQRRLGAYAGLGGGSALVLGELTRQQMSAKLVRGTPTTKKPKGPVKDLVLGLKDGKKARTPILLGTGAVLAGAGGIAAYKHGISERNRPYR